MNERNARPQEGRAFFVVSLARSHLLDKPSRTRYRDVLEFSMAAAAMAPRVRTMVICDDVSASLTEHRVFTLEGVRFDLVTTNLPCRAPLNVFLLLSNPRKGTFPGQILLINERNDKLLRFVKFVAEFHGDNQMLPCCIDLGECAFPNDGLYRFEVSFSVLDADVLKGEHPFTLILDEG